jgi:hypothetical protein
MKNQFKFPVLIAVAVLITISLNAEDKVTVTADPFPAERPGQYVYYHDMRTGIYGNKAPLNRLMGILKIADKKYLVRICNLSDGKTFLYSGRYVLNKGIMEFSPENMQGDAKEGAMIMADLLNLLNYLGSETIKYGQKLTGKNDFSVNSTWENYHRKLVNSYKWWIPFYKLVSSSNAENVDTGMKGDLMLKLVCFGSVYDADAETFTSISNLPIYYNEKSDLKKYIIPETEKVTVKLSGRSFILDKNWNYEKPDQQSGIMHETYWLKKFTVRDAQIGIESIDVSNMRMEKNEIESFVSTLVFQSCVITDTVHVDPENKTLSLSLWDPQSGHSTITKYRSLGIKKNVLTLLNFSAFDFIYYGNMNYFNTIINTKAD